jgi:hypothetical protein
VIDRPATASGHGGSLLSVCGRCPENVTWRTA